MRFDWKVFAVAFMFSFIVGVLAFSSFYLFLLYPNNLSLQMWLSPFIQVVSFIISPLLLFASFYLIGRNIYLESDFLSVFLSLFIGSWAGQLVRFIISVCISHVLESAPSTLLSTLLAYLWAGFTLAFSFEFFVGFTALAMAYIVKKRKDHKLGLG